MTCEQESMTSPRRYVPLLGIGRGGMGRIDVALAVGVPGAEKLVVLKRLLEPQQQNEEERAGLLREASLSSRLTHANIVATLGLDLLDADLVLVLEYLEGASLGALTRLCTAHDLVFPRKIALRALRDTLAGLDHAHELDDFDGTPLGIVHRDVSPSNVLLTIDGACKILDFGIAKVARSHVDTPPGLIKGKLGYMAPEQILGYPTDRRADIYAVGVMLWESLTRQRFSPGESVHECLSVRFRDNAPSVRELAPNVPAALEHIVQRCLARCPEHRWPTAAALRAALDEYVSAHGEEASPQDVSLFVSRLYGGVLAARRQTLRDRIARFACAATTRELENLPAPAARSSTPAVAIDVVPETRAEPEPAPASAVRPRARASKVLPLAAGLIGAIGSWCFSSLSPAHAGATIERAPHDVGIETEALSDTRPREKLANLLGAGASAGTEVARQVASVQVVQPLDNLAERCLAHRCAPHETPTK